MAPFFIVFSFFLTLFYIFVKQCPFVFSNISAYPCRFCFLCVVFNWH